MRIQIERHWIVGCLVLWLVTACSTVAMKSPGHGVYSTEAKHQLYKLERWSFEGRLAIASQADSWSAAIDWLHTPEQEDMKLSGPLGQGATRIRLTEDSVTIDRGDGKVQTSEQPEEFINQQLGIFVPLRSLRYWVIGLPEPSQDFIETMDGFTQNGWLITYKEMQITQGQPMPRKLSVTNTQAKLKLIVDQWVFNNANTK